MAEKITYVDFRAKKTIEAEVSPKDAFKSAWDSLLNAVEDAPEQEQPKPKKTRRKTSQKIIGDGNEQSSSGQVGSQYIKGNNNKQTIVNSSVTNNIYEVAGKAPKPKLSPTPGTIGANIALKNRITTLIKQIEEYRKKRMGSKFRYGVIHGELAKAFGLKNEDWPQIYLWDEHRADEVLQWLQGRLDNTQLGRVKRAYKGEGFQKSREYLYADEKNFVEQLGWSQEKRKNVMAQVTGKLSRVDMDDNEFRNWVMHLRSKLEKMYGETED
ncbi:hypothetical protein [Shewanella sp. KJ2020]|uniref:hypothetical protein n=1 Tax=Shewanella sp. KJ2020 TaxID=2919172 RepID=UPI0020A7DA56|nr:hypothetical protein [Shewanella sp. KJ2020]MCP3130046.1 hypothetical protein [Shewanella sp. KJ2020]